MQAQDLLDHHRYAVRVLQRLRRLDHPWPVRKERVHAGRGIRRARHAGGAEPGVREDDAGGAARDRHLPVRRRESGVRAHRRNAAARQALLHHRARTARHLQPTYDLDIVPGATTDDLDPQLVAGLLARVREQHPRVFADRDGIDVLLDLQVLRHDDSDESEVGGILRPTLAGLLALGRYPQKFYPRLGISIAVFPGTSRDDVFRGDERLVASKSVVGSIPVMIDDAVDSLMRWIGAKKPDYPPLVLREAIANALTHRDYSPDARGTQVHISVFTDRIEITNPGGLYGMVTHDVLASPHPVTGAPFVSTRNQFLFTLLESTPYPGGGFVNPEGGDGYQRIAAALREAGIEPATTRNDINTFTMTITKQRTMANSSPGDVVKAIMTVLERHSAMSVKEIMRELQLTPLAATSGMRELMKEGRVVRVKFADDSVQRYRLKG